MATYQFQQRVNLSQLHDEILAAIPATQPIGEGAAREAVMRVEGTDDMVRISVPDSVTEQQLAAVLAAHTPRRRQRPRQASEYRAEWAGATQARKQQILARLLGVEDPELVDEAGAG